MAFLFGEGVGKRLVITSLSQSVICNIFKTFKFMLAIYGCRISTVCFVIATTELLVFNGSCCIISFIIGGYVSLDNWLLQQPAQGIYQ